MFQSTHPARGATGHVKEANDNLQVSIHAPRAGCDITELQHNLSLVCVSIHAPRAGCDLICYHCLVGLIQFQSTHPARGATNLSHPARGATKVFMLELPLVFSFNPRTPRGVRPPTEHHRALNYDVSIHAPRAGCDFLFASISLALFVFQSTHPARGAT